MLAVLVAFSCGGCGGEPQNQTIPGLQEQTKVQQEQIKELKQQVAGLKNEKVAVDQAGQARIEDIKREYEERQANAEELHRSKLAQLESEISNLRLELGSVQREKIALQELLEREPRIEAANSTRRGYDTIVFGVMIAALIAMLLFVVYRYRSVQDRLNLLTMQQASELRRIGARS